MKTNFWQITQTSDIVEGKSNQSLLLTDPEPTTLNSEAVYTKSGDMTIQINDTKIIIVCVGHPPGKDKEASR